MIYLNCPILSSYLSSINGQMAFIYFNQDLIPCKEVVVDNAALKCLSGIKNFLLD